MCRGFYAVSVLSKESPWPALSSFFLPRESGEWNSERQAGISSQLHPSPSAGCFTPLGFQSPVQLPLDFLSPHQRVPAIGGAVIQLLQVNTQLSKNSIFLPQVSRARAGLQGGNWRAWFSQTGRLGPRVCHPALLLSFPARGASKDPLVSAASNWPPVPLTAPL